MPNDPVMETSHRALQLWSLLVLAARNQIVLSYKMVAQMTGLASEHPVPLGHIAYYCMFNDLPLLPALELGQETGNPNANFYDSIDDIASEQRRCFVFDWLKHGAPTPEALEDCYRNRAKIEEAYESRRSAPMVS